MFPGKGRAFLKHPGSSRDKMGLGLCSASRGTRKPGGKTGPAEQSRCLRKLHHKGRDSQEAETSKGLNLGRRLVRTRSQCLIKAGGLKLPPEPHTA